MFMLFFDRSKKILIFWSLPDAYFFSRPSQILFTFWSEPALIPHFFIFQTTLTLTFSGQSHIRVNPTLYFLLRLRATFSFFSHPWLLVQATSKCLSFNFSWSFAKLSVYVKSAKFISFWFNLLHIIIRRADNDPCLSKGSLQCQFLHNFCDCQNCTLFCQKDVNLEN